MNFMKKLIAGSFAGFFSLSIALAQVGNPAPNFTVTDTHGNTHSLYGLLDSGRVVVLDFFYTTCGPCQFYTPQVNLAYEKYGCNQHEVFFMSIDYHDTNTEVIAYDETYNIKYPSVSGLDGGGDAVVNLYAIQGFPTFYVIDASKTIVKVIDPPTLQVFDFRFGQLGIQPANCNLSATEEALGAAALIFPNPVTGEYLNLSPETLLPGVSSFEIFDLGGRICQQGKMEALGQSVSIPIPDLPRGAYFLRLRSGETGALVTRYFVKA